MSTATAWGRYSHLWRDGQPGRARRHVIDVLREALQVLRLDPSAAVSIGMAPVTLPGPSWRDTWWREARAEAIILRMLNAHDDGLHKRINERAALMAAIAKYQHEGKVRLMHSGRDCDCVDFRHPAGEIDATWAAFAKHERDAQQWADGPLYVTVVPWDADIPYESRDRVLEAYEDGHPHSVVSDYA